MQILLVSEAGRVGTVSAKLLLSATQESGEERAQANQSLILRGKLKCFCLE